MSEQFITAGPTLDAYWRAIILFGHNSASYKFALGKALLELAKDGKTFLKLEDIAPPFAKAVAAHLASHDRQGTSGKSRFLETCRQFNRGEITEAELFTRTVELGFANVIDAFHVVNQGEVAAAAQKGKPRYVARVYVLTQQATPGEFVNLDEKERKDSVKDIKEEWKLGGNGVRVVDSPENAHITLEVLDRNKVQDGATGVAVPIFGGVSIASMQATYKKVLIVRLSVVGRDYKTDIVQGGRYWTDAAAATTKMVERWLKENYNVLFADIEKK